MGSSRYMLYAIFSPILLYINFVLIYDLYILTEYIDHNTWKILMANVDRGIWIRGYSDLPKGLIVGNYNDWIISDSISNDTHYAIIGYKGSNTSVTIPDSIDGKMTSLSVYVANNPDAAYSNGISYYPCFCSENFYNLNTYIPLNAVYPESTGHLVTDVIVGNYVTTYSVDTTNSTNGTNGILYSNASAYRLFVTSENLKTISWNIPNSVTNMSSTFYNCSNLTGSIPNIPNSVTSMFYTFYYCSNLTGTIPNIPDSVTNMYTTFSRCSNLTGLPKYIGNNVTDMGYTFQNCTNLTGTTYIHSTEVSNARYCFSSTSLSKNVYIHYTYDNGVYTKTYNSFNSAGYFGGINGVTMYNF